MAELDEKARAAFEGKNFWHVATANEKGIPHASAMWVMLRDGRIVLNSAIGRRKVKNMQANPHVGLSWADPENPYVSYAIQGRIVETIEGDQAEKDIDALAKKYVDEDVYPWRQPGEKRISFEVEPTHVHRQG